MTFTVPVELVRQLRRRRTLVAFGVMAALPLIVVAAIKLGPQSGRSGRLGSGALDLVGLATAGAWNFTLTMLLFASGFLLVVIAALFLGDTVASEASWSTLRYLLAAPIPRRRLLRTKAIVGLILAAASLLILVVVSLVVGALAFGASGLTSPLGGSFGGAESLQRTAVIVVYLGLMMLVPAGVAFLMTVLTDAPLGAVGAAVLLVIVTGILDALEPLGDLRRLLPGHYGRAWTDALGAQIAWDNMAVGAASAVIVFAVLVAVAVLRFDRKDILS